MAAHRRRQAQRKLRALWRDTRALVRQFRLSLIIFALLVSVGALALRIWYRLPESGQPIDWGQALHAAFMLIFLEATLPLPHAWWLQILFYLVPVVGAAVVADGLIRFSVALFSRMERKEAWQVAIASTYRDHVIVCGLGRIGYRVAQELLDLHEDVVGIESDPEQPFIDDLREMGVPVLIDNARQLEVLEKAQASRASAIAVCTEDDLANLDIALGARELNPGIKVVLRMFDARLAERVRRGFGIHTAFSTSALAAPMFAAAATRAQIDYSFHVDDLLLNVARTIVAPGSLWVDRSIEEMEQTLDLSVILLRRGTQTDLHPDPDILLEAGDCLVVFASLASLARLREETGNAREPREASEQ